MDTDNTRHSALDEILDNEIFPFLNHCYKFISNFFDRCDTIEQNKRMGRLPSSSATESYKNLLQDFNREFDDIMKKITYLSKEKIGNLCYSAALQLAPSENYTKEDPCKSAGKVFEDTTGFNDKETKGIIAGNEAPKQDCRPNEEAKEQTREIQLPEPASPESSYPSTGSSEGVTCKTAYDKPNPEAKTENPDKAEQPMQDKYIEDKVSAAAEKGVETNANAAEQGSIEEKVEESGQTQKRDPSVDFTRKNSYNKSTNRMFEERMDDSWKGFRTNYEFKDAEEEELSHAFYDLAQIAATLDIDKERFMSKFSYMDQKELLFLNMAYDCANKDYVQSLYGFWFNDSKSKKPEAKSGLMEIAKREEGDYRDLSDKLVKRNFRFDMKNMKYHLHNMLSNDNIDDNISISPKHDISHSKDNISQSAEAVSSAETSTAGCNIINMCPMAKILLNYIKPNHSQG